MWYFRYQIQMQILFKNFLLFSKSFFKVFLISFWLEKNALRVFTNNFDFGAKYSFFSVPLKQRIHKLCPAIETLIRIGSRKLRACARNYQSGILNFKFQIILFQIRKLHMVLFKLEMIQANNKLFYTDKKLYN